MKKYTFSVKAHSENTSSYEVTVLADNYEESCRKLAVITKEASSPFDTSRILVRVEELDKQYERNTL